MTMADARSPGDRSTAATVGGGYDASRFNALRHGVLSQHSVLPWEDPAEYQTLLDALALEHAPRGPTETHLVTELAGVIWRKRRLRQAEHASFQRGLLETTKDNAATAQSALVLTRSQDGPIDVSAALVAGSSNIALELAELDDDRRLTLAAIEMLGKTGNRTYEDALDTLHEGTRIAWHDQLTWRSDDYADGVVPYEPSATSLRTYLEAEILPWYERTSAEIQARPQILTQAYGESLDPDRLERLGRYEVHLDRKFERTLSTLLKLQELRRGRDAGSGA